MRPAPTLLLGLSLLVPGAAFAHDHDVTLNSIDGFDVHRPVEWGPRHDARRSRLEIVTEDGTVSLLITDDRVAMQLSDRTMRRIERKIERERDDDEDSAIGVAIRDAVLGGVRALLRRSLECPIDELRDARVRNGRLELIDRHGHRIFDGVEVNDRQVMESFSESDLRAFLRELDVR